VRRGLAGLLFFVAAILLALAAGGWWLQRVAFNPSSSQAVAREVFSQPELRNELAALVANEASPVVGRPANELTPWISNTVLANPQAAVFLGDVVADIHGRLIGGDEVTVSGQQLAEITRDQRAAALPAVTLPVESVSVLETTDTILRWLVPVAAIVGLVAIVLGVLAHPERADAVFGIGTFCILAAVLAMVLGYVVPMFLLPLLTDNPWADVFSAAANDQLRLVAGVSCLLAVVGVVLILGSSRFRRRKTGWSSPVRVNRYSGEQRRWS
jgi:hypothetical protein